MSEERLKKRLKYWKRRARSAEAELDRVKREAVNRVNDLHRDLERLERQAHAGDLARQELSDRAAYERGKQGIYG